MPITLSWWVLGLALGATAPLWLKALSEHWRKKRRQRTEAVIRHMREQPMDDSESSR